MQYFYGTSIFTNVACQVGCQFKNYPNYKKMEKLLMMNKKLIDKQFGLAKQNAFVMILSNVIGVHVVAANGY